MKKLGVIPARYGSTRFEGKPLKLICGHPMIEWVYKRTLKADLEKVVVATDDYRIKEIVENFGGEVIMTSKDHPSGTDRIVEVANKYKDYDIIVNIQGDEPLIEAEMINQVANAFNENIKMATLKHFIDNKDEIENENVVKVVCDKDDFAIYFSRSPIPFPRKYDKVKYYRHIGIYGYRRDFLLKYSEMEPTILESTESLEQLRVLENGFKIKVLETDFTVRGVDTLEDLIEVEKIIIKNNIKL